MPKQMIEIDVPEGYEILRAHNISILMNSNYNVKANPHSIFD